MRAFFRLLKYIPIGMLAIISKMPTPTPMYAINSVCRRNALPHQIPADCSWLGPGEPSRLQKAHKNKKRQGL
jgi:hypothetical protein